MKSSYSQQQLDYHPSSSFNTLQLLNDNHLMLHNKHQPPSKKQSMPRVLKQHPKLKDQICILTSFQRYQLKALFRDKPLLQPSYVDSYNEKPLDNHVIKGNEVHFQMRQKAGIQSPISQKRSIQQVNSKEQFPRINMVESSKSMQTLVRGADSQSHNNDRSPNQSPLAMTSNPYQEFLIDIQTHGAGQLSESNRRHHLLTASNSRNVLPNSAKQTIALSSIQQDLNLNPPQTAQVGNRVRIYQMDPQFQVKLQRINEETRYQSQSVVHQDSKQAACTTFENYLEQYEPNQSHFGGPLKNKTLIQEFQSKRKGSLKHLGLMKKVKSQVKPFTAGQKTKKMNKRSGSLDQMHRQSPIRKSQQKSQSPPQRITIEQHPQPQPRVSKIFQNRYYSNNFVENAGAVHVKNQVFEKRFLLTDLIEDLKNAIYNRNNNPENKVLENLHFHNEKWMKILRKDKNHLRNQSPQARKSAERILEEQFLLRKKKITTIDQQNNNNDDEPKLIYNE